MNHKMKFLAFYKPSKNGKEWNELPIKIHKVAQINWEDWCGGYSLSTSHTVTVIKDNGNHLTLTLSEIELMEFVGLSDKNNVEIYDQYIVKDGFDDLYLVEKGFASKDTENSPACWVLTPINHDGDIIGLSYNQSKELEVVGNAFETPKLFNKKN